MITVRVESWSHMLPEAKELFPLHWKELAIEQEHIKIDMDAELYELLEKQNALHVVTVRSAGKLVGYIIGFLRTHMHYKSSGLMALTDMYFILPEYRNGSGVRMFMEYERTLKARGVVNAITSCKNHLDQTELLQKLGWTWTDKTFCKYLG